jgi:hypothetical protein
VTPAADPEDPRRDPTRMSNQPALRTSRGAIWLVVAGILAAIALTEFILLLGGATAVLPVVGIVVVAVLYLAMIVSTLAIPASPVRLRVLAALMIAIAVVALVLLAIIASVNARA